MSATVSVAAQYGRRMSANKPMKSSGRAIMACAMKRIEAPIESTMGVQQLLRIPVTWEWKRDNGTMKRIASTTSVQLSHIPVTWEDSGTQSRFHTLLIRSQYAQVVPFALPWRLYCVSIALVRAPTLCACFEHVQNKRQGLALQVAHGDPIALLTRHQLALRDLDSLCIALLYFRTRSGSAIMIVGRCDWNSLLSKVKTRPMRSQNSSYTRSESAVRATWAQ